MTKPFKQSDKSFEDINQRVWRHVTERDWQDNSTRGLATSILLEAAELLEHYQWRDEPIGDRAALGEELADIFIYAFQFAQANNIDIAEAIELKLQKAAKKYPAKDFKGKTAAERKKNWLDSKLKYRKEGL
jgi:NTP pyrophosphatase (non-canonical NTP hydrolase)